MIAGKSFGSAGKKNKENGSTRKVIEERVLGEDRENVKETRYLQLDLNQCPFRYQVEKLAEILPPVTSGTALLQNQVW